MAIIKVKVSTYGAACVHHAWCSARPVVAHDLKFEAAGRLGAEGKWFVVDRRSNILVHDGDIPRGANAPVEGLTVHLLGIDRGEPVWAVEAHEEIEVPALAQWIHLRQLFGSIEEQDWALAGRAAQIVNWDRDHRYCGRCASPTDAHAADRARVCPQCGLMAYPRLTPAIITLVERDDGKALLAKEYPNMSPAANEQVYDTVSQIWSIDGRMTETQARATFADELYRYVIQGGFSGVVLDFESIPARAHADYVTLVREVAAMFRAYQVKLLVAVPASDPLQMLWRYAAGPPDTSEYRNYGNLGRRLLGDDGALPNERTPAG